MDKYKLYDENLHLFAQMLKDIENATQYIYLETYRFGNDPMGEKFKKALTKKAKEGMDVKILMDGYGSGVSENFFSELKNHGAEVKLFRKITFNLNMIKRNNHRDHRKLLIIDGKIVYIGSANITQISIGWRELTLRMEHTLAHKFKDLFLQNMDIAYKFYFMKRKHIVPIRSREFEILRDVPSFRYRVIKKKLIVLIKNAKKEVIIETPYFLPSFRIREALKKAAKRGVNVKIIIPVASDVRIADIVRQKYFGKLYESGVDIMFYRPEFIHSKAMLIDNKVFGIGSSNMDYRSATLQFEINLFGTNKNIIGKMRKHFDKTLEGCEEFDYIIWHNRSFMVKMLERFLSVIEYWL